MDEAGQIGEGVGGQGQAGGPRDERADRGFRLHPGQRRSQAVVQTEAEAQMAARGRGGRVPGDVETVGIGEDGRVPAGGGHQDDHAVTAGEGVPGHGRLGERDPHRELGGRVVAKHLLDGRRGELRSFAQQSQLVGIAQQSNHSVTDEVDTRLHARDQQEHADAQHLGRGEDLALFLHPDEHAQQVVGGVRPPLPDQGVQVGDDLLAGSAPVCDVLR